MGVVIMPIVSVSAMANTSEPRPGILVPCLFIDDVSQRLAP